jgi:hypothetical protein
MGSKGFEGRRQVDVRPDVVEERLENDSDDLLVLELVKNN